MASTHWPESLSQTCQVGWTHPLPPSVPPCRQWHFTSRSLDSALSPKQSCGVCRCLLFAKLMLSCGFESLLQQQSLPGRKPFCLCCIWRPCENLGAQRPLAISAMENFVSKIPGLILKYDHYVSVFWGRENLSRTQHFWSSRWEHVTQCFHYWQQLLSSLWSSHRGGLGSAFPKFALNATSVLDHRWSFLSSKVSPSPSGWLFGGCLAM